MIDKERIKKDQEEITRSPNEITWWRAEEGKNTIRILRGPDDTIPYKKVYTHFRIGPNNRTLTCLKTFGKRCPICAEGARLIKEGREAEGKALLSVTRYLFNIIDFKEPNKVQVMTCGPQIFSSLAMMLTDDNWGDFSDPDTGYNIIIERRGQKLDTEYTVIPSRTNTPLKRKELLEKLVDLESLIVERSEEEMLAILRGEEEEPDDEVVEEKEGDEVKGHDYECFGKKYDPNDIECQQCEERENCERVYESLKE